MSQECFIPKNATSKPIDVELVPLMGLRIYKYSPESAMIQVRSATSKQGRIANVTLNREECERAAAALLEIAERLPKK